MTHFHIPRLHKPSATAEKPIVSTIPCGCGCGELIPARDSLGRARKFAAGHVARVTKRDVWSEEKKNRFRTLWLTGRTIRQIGEELSMPANTVSGRALRMGLPGRGSPLNDALNLSSEERRRRDQVRQNALRQERRAPRLAVDNSGSNISKKIAVRKVARPMVELDQSRQLLIGEVTRETCAFPTSTERAPTHSGVQHKFCGCPVETGKSFCPGHMAIAFPKSTVPEEIAA